MAIVFRMVNVFIRFFFSLFHFVFWLWQDEGKCVIINNATPMSLTVYFYIWLQRFALNTVFLSNINNNSDNICWKQKQSK